MRRTVSTPVTWEEVERCADSGRPELLTFDADTVRDRIDWLGDVFAPSRLARQRLAPLR